MKSPLPAAQFSNAKRFRQLHLKTETFVMPCAWDPASAIVFEELGFPCVGTTSGGVNWARGREDYVYSVPCEQMLEESAAIARATSLPVSGDLENAYGERPDEVANTIRASIDRGMVSGSIEDQATDPPGLLFDMDLAVERIVAAREAADAMGLAYTLTARCEAYFTECTDPYGEAVERLNRYRAAGADCLFVPGVSDVETLKRLVVDVDDPISFGMGATSRSLSVETLSALGVRRIWRGTAEGGI